MTPELVLLTVLYIALIVLVIQAYHKNGGGFA